MVKLEIVGSEFLYIAALYKLKEDDQYNLDMFRCSLDKLAGKKGNILDFGISTCHSSPRLTASHQSNQTVALGQCTILLKTFWMISTLFKL